ncbi:DNA-binding transcriptional regulator [Hydrogenophaga sp. BPS33]|uniref:DNA-binding transcriptional regulator n=1 Tax=Hydrogenophaga sp. BPS33 TaxID=2651974 RepID=UPI001F2FC2A0|nr:DNA-binding transcriptional regulator [Hydrogenophaga sp. BPS33]
MITTVHTGMGLPEGPHKEVRGLARGIQLLRALNRSPGGIATTTQLANACGIHRTTVKRLLETLRAEGLVRHGERDGQYYLTFGVRRLSEGFEDESWILEAATPLMHASVKELLWPCDLTTMEAGFMVVRESTHRWSSLSQHHAMIGQKMPMFVTAAGRAYLAACQDEEFEALMAILRKRADWIGEWARDKARIGKMVRETRRRGFAINTGEWVTEPHFGGIAVPVHSGNTLLGAVSIIFPINVVSGKDLRERFAPRLVKLASAIGKHSQPWLES